MSNHWPDERPLRTYEIHVHWTVLWENIEDRLIELFHTQHKETGDPAAKTLAENGRQLITRWRQQHPDFQNMLEACLGYLPVHVYGSALVVAEGQTLIITYGKKGPGLVIPGGRWLQAELVEEDPDGGTHATLETFGILLLDQPFEQRVQTLQTSLYNLYQETCRDD
jgi:hypothetical protein